MAQQAEALPILKVEQAAHLFFQGQTSPLLPYLAVVAVGQAQQQAQVTQGQGAGLEAAVPVAQEVEQALLGKVTTVELAARAAITEAGEAVAPVQ